MDGRRRAFPARSRIGTCITKYIRLPRGGSYIAHSALNAIARPFRDAEIAIDNPDSFWMEVNSDQVGTDKKNWVIAEW